MSDKEIYTLLKDALPFIGIGTVGGVVRALNTQPFSWKRLFIRGMTGGFVGGLLILYLSALNYSVATQGIICGTGGVLGAELLAVLTNNIRRKVMGRAKDTSEMETLCRNLYIELKNCLFAAPQNFKVRLEYALAQGFPIDFQDNSGWTVLHWALFYENAVRAGIPEILLDHGADPDIADKKGERPLYQTIFYSHPLELAGRLIRAGADVNAQTKDGRTAFCLAAQWFIYGNNDGDRTFGMRAATRLLDYGADPYLNIKWTQDEEDVLTEHKARRAVFKKWTEDCLRRKRAGELETKADSEVWADNTNTEGGD